MADIEVTLNHSENYSSSTAKTYRGYVINSCDNSKVDDGTWAVTSNSYTGYKINSNKIDVWNINTTSSDESSTFTWTSSKVSGCSKTLKVTVPGAVVTLKSGNTEIVVIATYDKSGIVYNTSYEDEFLINGSSEGIVTTLSVLTGETITTCNGDMDNYWSNHIQSTSNTNKMNFAFNNGLNTYLIGCSDNYNSSGSYTINLKYYDREMTISFPVKFKFKYDDEVQEVQYKWYTMLPGQNTWSESTEFTITMSENDSYFGVGGIVAISHCTGSDRNDCDITFTFKNDNTITLNKSWGLSDLRYDNTDDNVILLYTYKDLYDNLLVADTGTYTISGEIVSSLDGSSFPVTVNYKVEKQKTTVNCTISLSCGLKYTNKYCSDRLPTSTDADISIQCDNLTQLYWSYSYAAMPNGLNTTIDLGNIELDDVYSGILPSGVVEVTLPFIFITSTPSFTISFGGDASGSKTFYGARDNCVDYGDNPISGYHYTFDAGLSASGYFNSTTTTSISISVSIG